MTRGMLGLLLVAALVLGVPGAAEAGVHRTHITDRAVAAVMLDHLPARTSWREGLPAEGRPTKGARGASVRYHAGAGYDGDLVGVMVALRQGKRTCKHLRQCTWLGHGVQLIWERLTPGEDPGFVVLTARHAHSIVTVVYTGPKIRKDPRRMHLEFPVRRLRSLVKDKRLRLSTTVATVRAGKQVRHWHPAPR